MVWLLPPGHCVHQPVYQLHSRTLHPEVVRICPALSGTYHYFPRTHRTRQHFVRSSIWNHTRFVGTYHLHKYQLNLHCIVFHQPPYSVPWLSNARGLFLGGNAMRRVHLSCVRAQTGVFGCWCENIGHGGIETQVMNMLQCYRSCILVSRRHMVAHRSKV